MFIVTAVTWLFIFSGGIAGGWVPNIPTGNQWLLHSAHALVTNRQAEAARRYFSLGIDCELTPGLRSRYDGKGCSRSRQGAIMISHIDHLLLAVSDIDASLAFYSRALQMDAVSVANALGSALIEGQSSLATFGGIIPRISCLPPLGVCRQPVLRRLPASFIGRSPDILSVGDGIELIHMKP